MKVAPVMAAISRVAAEQGLKVEQRLIHTGQHYSPEMSDLFFTELGLPEPDINLGIGGGSHAENTGRVMIEFEKVLLAQRSDAVLVVGDVNSTIACALVAKKLGIDVIHVESGLRSFDMRMPEEVNRVLTDRISDWLYVSEPSGVENLQREGVDIARVQLVGNVMIDSLLAHKEKALARPTLVERGLKPGGYTLVTLHRPSNVDDASSFAEIAAALAEISSREQVVFPVHPRTRQRIEEFGLSENFARVRLEEPLGYLDFVNFMTHAKVVLTDSGGIQEETTILGVPCLTLRENTERPATLTHGTNRLVALTTAAILAAYDASTADRRSFSAPDLWDGQASRRIAEHLLSIYA